MDAIGNIGVYGSRLRILQANSDLILCLEQLDTRITGGVPTPLQDKLKK